MLVCMLTGVNFLNARHIYFQLQGSLSVLFPKVILLNKIHVRKRARNGDRGLI
jgi:hypothetical protein